MNNAFLNGDLDEEVYTELPKGYLIQRESIADTKLVCKLHKSLYGLKQASRQWNVKLTAALLEYGFIQSKSNYSLFTMRLYGHFLTVLVYIDDILIGCESSAVLEKFKSYLADVFKLKDLGSPKYFLGLELARPAGGIALNQRKYVLDLLI